MKGFVCGVCGFVSINGSAPESCPICHSTKFVEKEDALKTEELEGNEKHVPVIEIDKKCSIGEDCTDVSVKVGEVIHPMEPEHSILFIDVYVDKELVSRIHLTPGNYPGLLVHLKAKKGKISVVEMCNVHGAWIKEIDF